MNFEELARLESRRKDLIRKAESFRSNRDRLAWLRQRASDGQENAVQLHLRAEHDQEPLRFNDHAKRALDPVLKKALPDLIRVAELQLDAEIREITNEQRIVEQQLSAYLEPKIGEQA